ncbi:hypothetical protein PPERSA_04695 [Pseudocohnilembus persalinus]|uniref:Uncharacterized protein n=1 Tax=Pseudocohnilembus persalinus TaxID=266149 RepID=A0A0V0R4H7_PSEPJ|nr:hypothetical protein PPERSA_04695 [Pseudocohnilembus persalinus]|eukprot:KRX09389.1 hypothetical protein PPERSA_04695 [Pseudocohnilembus persalinus]
MVLGSENIEQLNEYHNLQNLLGTLEKEEIKIDLRFRKRVQQLQEQHHNNIEILKQKIKNLQFENKQVVKTQKQMIQLGNEWHQKLNVEFPGKYEQMKEKLEEYIYFAKHDNLKDYPRVLELRQNIKELQEINRDLYKKNRNQEKLLLEQINEYNDEAKKLENQNMKNNPNQTYQSHFVFQEPLPANLPQQQLYYTHHLSSNIQPNNYYNKNMTYNLNSADQDSQLQQTVQFNYNQGQQFGEKKPQYQHYQEQYIQQPINQSEFIQQNNGPKYFSQQNFYQSIPQGEIQQQQLENRYKTANAFYDEILDQNGQKHKNRDVPNGKLYAKYFPGQEIDDK